MTDASEQRKGGRPKGSLNKTTREIRTAAQKHGLKGLRALVNLLDAKDESVRLRAAQELLFRGYGRSVLPEEILSPDVSA